MIPSQLNVNPHSLMLDRLPADAEFYQQRDLQDRSINPAFIAMIFSIYAPCSRDTSQYSHFARFMLVCIFKCNDLDIAYTRTRLALGKQKSLF